MMKSDVLLKIGGLILMLAPAKISNWPSCYHVSEPLTVTNLLPSPHVMQEFLQPSRFY